jgi:FkbM family methyltransferase
MKRIEGIWWPDTVGDRWVHALMHVKSIEWAIVHCKQWRTAVQAGGNIGLWPARMALSFQKVLTFEPDQTSRQCLELNVPKNVEVLSDVLGASVGSCGMTRRGLGSHNVIEGDASPVVPVDDFGLMDVDLVQFDVEGYELEVLKGAEATLARCKPLVQVELRESPLSKYGTTPTEVREWLSARGYRQVSAQQGSDFVFAQRVAA